MADEENTDEDVEQDELSDKFSVNIDDLEFENEAESKPATDRRSRAAEVIDKFKQTLTKDKKDAQS